MFSLDKSHVKYMLEREFFIFLTFECKCREFEIKVVFYGFALVPRLSLVLFILFLKI